MKLLIVGDGSRKEHYEQLTIDLKINHLTTFTGKIPHHKVPNYINMLDIYVALSVLDSESFGVAVIEASACEKPVVVSNVGGLPEVVEDGITGIIVPSKNPTEAAMAIEKLIMNKDFASKMGKAGRNRVIKLYNWSDNVNQMIDIYRNII